jgi:starch synthase
VNILMVTAEIAPFAKVGGLADVAGALSTALASRGHDVRVVLPLYGHLDRVKEKIRPLKKLPPLALRVGQEMHDVRFHVRGSTSSAVKIYLVECPTLFGKPGVYTDRKGYGFNDSLERAILHSQAALLLPRLLDWPVDVVHSHDANAVPAILFRQQWYAGRQLPGPAGTLLTIHNLAHQEVHAPDAVDTLGLPRSLATYPGLLEFHGQVNLLKAGILNADLVNTVSPGYARETTESPAYGCGLQEILRGRGADYSGILNGGDYQTWDPLRDKALVANYGPGRLAGKQKCRKALLKELNISPGKGKPVCGFVGRLVSQKGVDLLLPIMERLADDGFAFVFLGTGENHLEEAMREMAGRCKNRIAFVDRFDESLAHRIYAGSDLFLMPSHFEPCGLSQMYAMKYGTPPVVRWTGGLADTVTDAQEKDGTGFVFHDSRSESLLAVLRRAETMFSDADRWLSLQVAGMACDFSWELAAEGYEELYQTVIRKQS